MQVVIDDEKIIDLLETEWGYEGIREDVARVIRKNGTPCEIVTEFIVGDSAYDIIKNHPVSEAIKKIKKWEENQKRF